MAQLSHIEWTDATWNPVRGCTKVSAGCAHCYAERFAERWRGKKGHPYEEGFDLRLVPERLLDPFRWPQQRTIFVNSMSDLFHEQVPDDYVRAIFEVMHRANWHTYQVLTKRSARMRRFVAQLPAELRGLAHVWLGVSVEDQRHGVPRISDLRDTPCAVRFLSVEPLLERMPKLNLDGIHWMIVGGESGPGARPMERSWVRELRRQCRQQDVPFFFKQWGGTRKHATGRSLDGHVYDELPVHSARKLLDRAERLRRETEAREAVDQLVAGPEALALSDSRWPSADRGGRSRRAP